MIGWLVSVSACPLVHRTKPKTPQLNSQHFRSKRITNEKQTPAIAIEKFFSTEFKMALEAKGAEAQEFFTSVDPNKFREDHLYTPGVDFFLKTVINDAKRLFMLASGAACELKYLNHT